MSKLLATCAAVAITAMLALPAAASAAEHHTAGCYQNHADRHQRRAAYAPPLYRRHYVRHYYGSRYGYAPYNAYAYDPYYRPHYRPGFSVGVGPFGFGFGF